jgi:hypothetical protein
MSQSQGLEPPGAGGRGCLPRSCGSCSPPPSGGPARPGLVGGYRRAVEPAIRGAGGVVATAVAFAAGAAVGGRAGLAIASGWMLVAGTYCLANFRHCREAHCAVTGPGWTLAAALGFTAAAAPGAAMSWYRLGTQLAVFLAVLAAGHCLERLVAARAGRRALGGGRRAQDR